MTDVYGDVSSFTAVRNSMINAPPSWFTMAISFILGIQFFTLAFMVKQNKNNYEEMYKTIHSLFAKGKEK